MVYKSHATITPQNSIMNSSNRKFLWPMISLDLSRQQLLSKIIVCQGWKGSNTDTVT